MASAKLGGLTVPSRVCASALYPTTGRFEDDNEAGQRTMQRSGHVRGTIATTQGPAQAGIVGSPITAGYPVPRARLRMDRRPRSPAKTLRLDC